jgi:hypothetical protein
MSIIEWRIFHNKRTNLTVYEKHPVDFIGIQLYWYLEAEFFHDKRKNLTKITCSILLASSGDDIY